MKVEIWSDIACPFCYIGKAHFEKALSSFESSNEVEVEYKSYQLDPEYHHQQGDTAFSVLTEKKGYSVEQVNQMTPRIVQMAKDFGLVINFEKNLPANTFDAHRLIQLAIQEDKAEKIIDSLFKAHFEKGENIEDKEVLMNFGLEAGISNKKIEKLFDSDAFAYEVNQDIMDSRNLGISGVPFFLFNRKYAVSGAQPVEVFEGALKKSFEEWRKDNPKIVHLNKNEDDVCGTDGCII